MKYTITNPVTSEEFVFITKKVEDRILVVNKYAKYFVGEIFIINNKFKVEDEEHLFSSEKDAIDCLLNKILEEEIN